MNLQAWTIFPDMNPQAWTILSIMILQLFGAPLAVFIIYSLILKSPKPKTMKGGDFRCVPSRPT